MKLEGRRTERASTHAYRFRAAHQHNPSRALHSFVLAAGDVDSTPDSMPAFIVPSSSFWEAAVLEESTAGLHHVEDTCFRFAPNFAGRESFLHHASCILTVCDEVYMNRLSLSRSSLNLDQTIDSRTAGSIVAREQSIHCEKGHASTLT